jgi:hypothetical protein
MDGNCRLDRHEADYSKSSFVKDVFFSPQALGLQRGLPTSDDLSKLSEDMRTKACGMCIGMFRYCDVAMTILLRMVGHQNGCAMEPEPFLRFVRGWDVFVCRL